MYTCGRPRRHRRELLVPPSSLEPFPAPQSRRGIAPPVESGAQGVQQDARSCSRQSESISTHQLQDMCWAGWT
eukprot:4599006-Alexandrium_andersonii.AAC.1